MLYCLQTTKHLLAANAKQNNDLLTHSHSALNKTLFCEADVKFWKRQAVERSPTLDLFLKKQGMSTKDTAKLNL